MRPTQSNAAERKNHFVNNAKDLRTTPLHNGRTAAWNEVVDREKGHRRERQEAPSETAYYHLGGSGQGGFSVSPEKDRPPRSKAFSLSSEKRRRGPKLANVVSNLEVQVRRRDNRIKELEQKLKESQAFGEKETERADNMEAVMGELKIEQRILIESLVENDGLVTSIKRMRSNDDRFYKRVRESYSLLVDMLVRREIGLVGLAYNLKTSVKQSPDNELAAIIMTNLTLVIEQLLELMDELRGVQRKPRSVNSGQSPRSVESRESRKLSSPDLAARIPLPMSAMKKTVDSGCIKPAGKSPSRMREASTRRNGRESPVEKELRERVEKYKKLKHERLSEAGYGRQTSFQLAKRKGTNWHRW